MNHCFSPDYINNKNNNIILFQIERGLTPIPKSTNRDRIAQNIDLFDFSLTEDEVNEISKFNKNIRVIEIDQIIPTIPSGNTDA